MVITSIATLAWSNMAPTDVAVETVNNVIHAEEQITKFNIPGNVIEGPTSKKIDNSMMVVYFNKDVNVWGVIYQKGWFATFDREKMFDELLAKKWIIIQSINHNLTKNYVYKKYKRNWIIRTYREYARISNRFANWQCTWYVAKTFFPFKTRHSQYRPWGWNGNQWYSNARAHWFKTGTTPIAWAMIWFRWGYGSGIPVRYGHIGVVRKVDWTNKKLLISDMNVKGRYTVTERWIDMYHPTIQGYIYYFKK